MACCVACGFLLKEHHKFCGRCGKPNESQSADANNLEKNADENPSKLTLTQFRSKREEKREKHFKASSW